MSCPSIYPALSCVALLQHGHMPFSQAALPKIKWLTVYISPLPSNETGAWANEKRCDVGLAQKRERLEHLGKKQNEKKKKKAATLAANVANSSLQKNSTIKSWVCGSYKCSAD